MKHDLTSQELESLAKEAQSISDEKNHPRPKWQTVFAWILTFIVIIAFLGTCYWMMFGRF